MADGEEASKSKRAPGHHESEASSAFGSQP